MPSEYSSSQPTREGLAVLNPLDQGFLIASILLFVLLSIISGRIVWKSYIAARRRNFFDYHFTSKKNHLCESESVGSFRELKAEPMIAASRPSIGKSTYINSIQSEATPTISTSLIKGEEYIASQSTGAEIRQ
ncbi:unnamed protein product [Albugo candida]|uniref:Uncharacterized protein n=1 Tax=Albugo candida TaxID=65357 RepID=A0A024FX64_9STRA|nr:unnamed protein product [Albugo candida]|eukprot:CCI11715.1 unnamed protein product [Albugo candida]